MEDHLNLPFYARNLITFNLKGRKNYSKFITHHLRRIERINHQPNGVLPDDALVNLDLKLKSSRVRLKMISSSLYIVGFEIGYHNNRLWELRAEGDPMTLQDSHPIGFRVNYPQGQGSVCTRRFGYDSLEDAVYRLTRSQHPDQDPAVRDHIMLIIIIFVESARFQWIFDTCNKCVQKQISKSIDRWVEDLVKNWAILSLIANRCTQDPVILDKREQKIVDERETRYLFSEEHETTHRLAKDLVRVLHLD